MSRRFGAETGLLLVDLQVGVDVLEHWGGPTGRRNNPDAGGLHAARLAGGSLAGQRAASHRGREARLDPRDGEVVVTKDVNGGFFGTNLELELRRRPWPARSSPGSSPTCA